MVPNPAKVLPGNQAAEKHWTVLMKEKRHAVQKPSGHTVFLLGINHLESTQAGKVSEAYCLSALNHIKQLGFTNGGYGTPQTIKKRFPFIADIAFTFNGHYQPKDIFRYQDIFDPDVQEGIRRKALELISCANSNPNLIGYYWTDTPRWDIELARRRRGTDWVSYLRQLPASAAGKQAYVNFLQKRYNNDPESYFQDYGHRIGNFSDLALYDFREFDREAKVALETDKAFLGEIARELYTVIGKVFKAHAPGKLIFGERYKLHDHPDRVLKEAAKWVDIISVQPGPEIGPLPGAGQDESVFDKETFDQIYEITKKPIIICDHQVSFYTPGHPTTLWHQCKTQKEAFSTATRFALKALEQPYVIGYQRCQYADVFNPERGNMLKQGIIQLSGEAYPGIDKDMRDMNESILAKWQQLWQQS